MRFESSGHAAAALTARAPSRLTTTASGRRSAQRSRGRGPLLGASLIVLVVVAVALTGAVVALTTQYWSRRYANRPWSTAESIYFGAAWVSVLLGQLGGLWLWWRAPRNPTGRWVWLAGVSLGVWFVGGYTPHRWATPLMLAVYAMRPALAMAILGWPTGRPNRTIRRWIGVYAVYSLVSGQVINLFNAGRPSLSWPQSLLSPFNSTWVAHTLGAANGLLSLFVPALAVIIVLVRQRRRLPVGARRLVTPITVAGILAAGSDLVTVPVSDLADRLLFDPVQNQQTVLGIVNLAQNYGQVAIATVGLLVAATLRRRAARTGERTLDIELGAAQPVAAPSAAVQRLLGDSSARVLYRRLADRWVDDQGGRQSPGGADRTVTPVVDGHGEVLAAIETDGRRRPNPTLVEVATSTVLMRLANERATALAAHRQAELTALQHDLLDATDSARRLLERDLHDGAQQQLVGVALTASLAARDPDPASYRLLEAEVDEARRSLLQVLDDATPVVLAGGLATALQTLAATTLVPTDVRIDGDLDGSDPLARRLWFLACEAVTNAVKHAGASALVITLSVEPAAVRLIVRDDGRGGVLVPPASIATRVAEGDGELIVKSPLDRGTEIVAAFRREPALGAAR